MRAVLLLVVVFVVGNAWSGELPIQKQSAGNQQTKTVQGGTENTPIFVKIKGDVIVKQDKESSDRDVLKEIAPMLSGVIAAGATILAVVVTSVFNLRVARLNIEAQSRQKAKEVKLEKLEELFFLFDKWQLNFSNIYLLHLNCYRGRLTFKEVLELVRGLTLLESGEAQKYRMVMEIHFPSLIDAYAPVEAARKRLVPFLSDPSVNNQGIQEFESHQVAFEQASETFKSHVSSLAHETLG